MTTVNVGNTDGGYPDTSKFRDQNLVLSPITFAEDGWITGLSVRAAGGDADTPGKLVIYTDDNELIYASEQQSWDTVIRTRSATLEAGGAIRIRVGKRLKCGLWGHPSYTRKWDQYPMPSIYNYRTATGGFDVPAYEAAMLEWIYALSCWVQFTPNARPSEGSWTANAPSGQVGELNPILEGTMPHPPEEVRHDHTKLVHVRIFDETTNALVVNTTFTPTIQERKQGFFSKRIYTHASGHSYYAVFRHMDSFGLWSNPSKRIRYSIANGPNQPTFPEDDTYGQNLPRKKTNKTTGIRYHAKYSHPENKALSQAQVEVWNGEQSIKLYDSGWVVPALAVNAAGDFGVDQWHAALPEGTELSYRVRARDNTNIIGGWSAFYKYRTNARPFIPTKSFPAEGILDSEGLLSVEVSDPDKDVLETVRFKIYDSANVLVGTIDRNFVPSNSRATVNASGVMTLAKTYQWTAESFDGALWSAPTSRNTFVYDTVPVTTMFFPSSSEVINRATPPSAEHSNASSGVSLTGTDTNLSFIITNDADALVGDHSWEVSKLGANGTAVFELVDKQPAQPNENWVIGVGLKALTGTINAKLEIACYNSTGGFIGVVGTQAGTDALSAHIAVDAMWKLYGSVSAASLPAGTSSIAPRVTADSVSAGKFRIDGWVLVKIPAGAPTSAFVDNYMHWFGYFDGDSKEYALSTDAYQWMGTRGASASAGRSVLTRAPADGTSVVFGYFQKNGALKNADRMYVEKDEGNGVYNLAYDSGWFISTRTAVPLPPQGQIINEGSYRVKVSTRDANGRVGTSAWAYFDVLYEGPHELVVRSIGGNSSRGVITIAWEATQEPHDDLEVIEVAVTSQEEGDKTIHRITDFNQTKFDYHFPVSGRSYEIRVRQIKRVGEAEIASLWEGGTTSVDYFPYYFVKDINNPENMLVFEPIRGSIPTANHTAPMDEYESLFGGPPIHVLGRSAYYKGSFTATLVGDDFIGLLPGVQLAAAEHFTKKRFACIMGQTHPQKIFAALNGDIAFSTTDYLATEVNFSWTETKYEEDLYHREGYKI